MTDPLTFPSDMKTPDEKVTDTDRSLERLANNVASVHETLKAIQEPSQPNGKAAWALARDAVVVILIPILVYLLMTSVSHGDRLSRVEETRFTKTMGEELRADLVGEIHQTETIILREISKMPPDWFEANFNALEDRVQRLEGNKANGGEDGSGTS